MKFFYQSGAMGFDGNGWAWHKVLGYSFPKFPVITKTVTLYPQKGFMYKVFPVPFKKSVWNRVGLVNKGLGHWLENYYNKDLILSLYIEDYNSLLIVNNLIRDYELEGIELNILCPNIKYIDKRYPITIDNIIQVFKQKTKAKKLYLKVGYDQDLSTFCNLNKVDGININSVPGFKGAVSGKMAQKKNWAFIEKWQGRRSVPPISGCSWTNAGDLYRLKNQFGCKNMGIGSVIITNPKFVEELKSYEY